MNSDREALPKSMDPALCRHLRFQRIGIQKAPVAPFRLYLLTCRVCGTTLASTTLRRMRDAAPRSIAHATVDDEGSNDDRDGEGPGRALPRRKAG